MKRENKINVSHITEIIIKPKKIHDYYRYVEPKKILFFFNRSGGYYYDYPFGGGFKSKEEIESDNALYCEDKLVYIKPRIIFSMSDGRHHTKFFENDKKLGNFLFTNPELSEIKWVKL